MIGSFNIVDKLLALPAILIAITFHEMAHGYAADAMGDPTPKLNGRLTLNPLKHLDWLGFLSMVIFRFGWAKPVPINSANFKDRKKGIIIVSLSGVLTNLLIAFVTTGVFSAIVYFANPNETLIVILQYIIVYNITFAVFNIIPIPPLDGSHILYECLPYNAQQKYAQFTKYGAILLIALMIMGVFGYIISPVTNLIYNSFIKLFITIFSLFG